MLPSQLAAQRFLDEIKEKNNKWIFKLILDQGIDKNIIKEINAITKKNKPKKGKKKKKKKKDWVVCQASCLCVVLEFI